MISERNSYWGVNRSNLGQSVRMRKLFRRDEGEAKEKAEAEVRSKALYDDMRGAIQNKDYRQMRTVIGNPDYNPNRVGAFDLRTALHTAAHEDDQEALSILLRQTRIDTNVKTTEGFTPFLLAASEGKMVSFEMLLNDRRVNPHARGGKDQTAMELITSLAQSLGREVKADKAKELLAKHDNSQVVQKDTAKLALLIGNSEYKANTPPDDSVTWDDLPGAKEDVTDMKAKLTAEGYQVELIENSPDLLQAVKDVMNKIPVASITHLQVLYAGNTNKVQGISIETLILQAMVSTR